MRAGELRARRRRDDDAELPFEPRSPRRERRRVLVGQHGPPQHRHVADDVVARPPRLQRVVVVVVAGPVRRELLEDRAQRRLEASRLGPVALVFLVERRDEPRDVCFGEERLPVRAPQRHVEALVADDRDAGAVGLEGRRLQSHVLEDGPGRAHERLGRPRVGAARVEDQRLVAQPERAFAIRRRVEGALRNPAWSLASWSAKIRRVDAVVARAAPREGLRRLDALAAPQQVPAAARRRREDVGAVVRRAHSKPTTRASKDVALDLSCFVRACCLACVKARFGAIRRQGSGSLHYAHRCVAMSLARL